MKHLFVSMPVKQNLSVSVFVHKCLMVLNDVEYVPDLVPDHVTFLNQVTYTGNLVQTELPIEQKPNQITFG